jgi:alpha-glucosidase
VFVRPGAILPIEPLIQSTDEQPKGPLTLRVFPGPNCKGDIYQDDGTSFAYKSGNFLRMSSTCEISPDHRHMTIHIGKHEGSYAAWWRRIAIEINGISQRPLSVTVDGRVARFSGNDHSVTISTSDQGNGMDIELLF